MACWLGVLTCLACGTHEQLMSIYVIPYGSRPQGAPASGVTIYDLGPKKLPSAVAALWQSPIPKL